MLSSTVNNKTVANTKGTKIYIANSFVTTELISLRDRLILRIPIYAYNIKKFGDKIKFFHNLFKN